MKRPVNALWSILCSRATSPVVIGLFLLVYIFLAFGTEDALTALIALVSQSLLLQLLLALLPLSSACRLVAAALAEVQKRRALTTGELPQSLYEESAQLAAPRSLDRLQERLAAEGYRTSKSPFGVAARRGVTGFIPRVLFLAGVFCLYAGILISVTSRVTHRAPVIEGEELPTSRGGGGVVRGIALKNGTGAILSRVLVMDVTPSDSGDPGKKLGLYPPSLYRGIFVYPRYLGFAPLIRFAAPDLPAPYQGVSPLTIYPAGKEEQVEVPRSPYRIVFGMEQPADGSDPYQTGRLTYTFRVMKGDQLLFAGSAPVGGVFSRDGYQVQVLESRRMVLTDFVQDYGVLLIWTALALFCIVPCIWLPIRLFFPQGEMLFLKHDGSLYAYSRAEGGRRRHGGVFHEALDLLEGEGAPGGAQG